MIVNEQKLIEFKNNCNCNLDYQELKNAIMWFSSKPVTRLKTIFIQGDYPAISIYGTKIHVHRILMMYWCRRKLDTTEYVHHKDRDKLNSKKANLELMEQSEHQSLHTNGRKLSEEHRKKISIANKNRKGVKVKKRYNIPHREITVFLKEGKSINWIANFYNVDWRTIKSRIYDNRQTVRK